MSSRTASGSSTAACIGSPSRSPISPQRPRRDVFAMARASDACHRARAGAPRASRLRDGERHQRRRGGRQRRRRARCAPASRRRRRDRRAARRAARAAVAFGGDLGDAGADRGLSARRITTCSSRATTAPSSTTSSAIDACRAQPTVYVCAQDRGDDDAPCQRRTAVLRSSTRPPTRRTRTFDTRRLRQCEETDLSTFSAHCGLDIQTPRQAIARTTPHGFRAAVPGDGRSALRPGVARLDGVLHAAGVAHATSGPVSGGRQRASGAGRADGGALGSARGAESDGGPRFDAAVAPSGYRWWYVDALSDDGDYGLTVIAFVGSVFSPYYAWSGMGRPRQSLRRQCRALWPARHALGDDRARPRQSVSARATFCRSDRARCEWRDGSLTIRVDEIAAPLPKRYPRRDRCRSRWRSMRQEFTLETKGSHVWRPIAPVARVSLDLDAPEPALERPRLFRHQRRRRAARTEPLPSGHGRAPTSATTPQSSTTPNGAAKAPLSLALRFDARRAASRTLDPPPVAPLPPTNWRVQRRTRAEDGSRRRRCAARGHALLCALARLGAASRASRSIGCTRACRSIASRIRSCG